MPDVGAGEQAGLVGELVADDALAATSLGGVVGELGALAVALLGDADDLLAFGGETHRQHAVVIGEAHADHTAGRPAHGPSEGLLEPDRLTLCARRA